MAVLQRLASLLPRTVHRKDASGRPTAPTVNISCFVDDKPRFRMQAWNWILSLKALETVCKIYIHYSPNALSDSIKAQFSKLGVRLIESAAYGDNAARYCNKIRQLETPEFLDADFVILSDADLIFLDDPAHLILPGKFRAKRVDFANPPETKIAELYKKAGLSQLMEMVPLEMAPGERTAATNFNGGLYVLPSTMATKLLPLWQKYANFALDQADLLGKYSIHADQLGMAMALAEMSAATAPLPAGANLPTHVPSEPLKRLSPQYLSALHYHGHVDQHGLPLPVGVDWIDEAINRARNTLVTERRRNFSNDIFWDFRYAQFPELGSGLGSRDEVLAYKQELLRPYVTMMDTASLLDVGCGDLEVFASLPVVNYTGLDVSEQALSIARNKRPDWTFQVRNIADVASEDFDYCSCIDVLIHQPGEAAAQALARDLVRVARKGLIFSAHSEKVEEGGISFNSSMIKDCISAMPEISTVSKIGSYRDVTLYFAEKGMGERRTIHDAGLQELAIGARHTTDLIRLKEIVEFSRSKIGFFPRTVIRMHEYPWFADQMQNCAGQRILDVGAGVCCLPFYFAERGAEVITVDRHSIIRNEEPLDGWNEWGFLDYGKLDSRIRSFNVDMSKFGDNGSYDFVYSVSVVEHMPATVRQAVISRIARLLRPKGRLFLSLDLMPGTNDLWNYNEGEIVDPTGHGTLEDLKFELAAASLPVQTESFLRNMQMSRTDVAYLTCKKV